MIKKYLLFGLGLLFSCMSFGQIELIKSNVNRDLGLISSEQKNKIWDLEDIADEKGFKEIRSIIAFIPKEGGENYFLERKLIVGSINETTKAVRAWPLTPWPYLLHPKELVDTYADAGFSGKPSSSSLYLNSSVSGVGCLNKTPLRYGKISNQPEQEFLLALLFNKQLIFFSPQYQRTVFATYYDASDAYTKKESDELKEDYGSRFMEKDAQFISRIYYGAHNIGMPGHRIYSKIYTNDFNKDGNTDILVWTKYYKSNKSTEPSGFTLLRNEFTHYSRDLTAQLKSEAGITGEYLPQETSPQTIQNWLSAKNLTWQKGFPSKSECAGEEGKLIPEMHDPLLNDPGVLK